MIPKLSIPHPIVKDEPICLHNKKNVTMSSQLHNVPTVIFFATTICTCIPTHTHTAIQRTYCFQNTLQVTIYAYRICITPTCSHSHSILSVCPCESTLLDMWISNITIYKFVKMNGKNEKSSMSKETTIFYFYNCITCCLLVLHFM